MKIVDGVVYIRKGDTETMSVKAKLADGTAYTFSEGDAVTFTVRELPDAGSEVLLEKTVVSAGGASVDIVLTAEQTAALNAGKYSCDVQLTDADGHIKTLFPSVDTDEPKVKVKNWKNCVVEGEVTVNG